MASCITARAIILVTPAAVVSTRVAVVSLVASVISVTPVTSLGMAWFLLLTRAALRAPLVSIRRATIVASSPSRITAVTIVPSVPEKAKETNRACMCMCMCMYVCEWWLLLLCVCEYVYICEKVNILKFFMVVWC